MLKFAANIGLLWPDRPLQARMRAAAAAGFRAVEFQFPYATPATDLARGAQSLGIRLLGINTPAPRLAQGELGVAALAGRAEDFRADFGRAVKYCELSGAVSIHVMAGNVPADGRPCARSVLADNLKFAAPLAAQHGLTLLLEALNSRDHPDYLYSDVSDVVAIIEDVGAANVKLQFDFYHVASGLLEAQSGRAVGAQTLERRLREVLEQAWPHLGHVQIAGVPSRAEPDEGQLDYRHVFEWLRIGGYSGWIGCEYRPRGETDAGLTWMETLGVAPTPSKAGA